MTKVPPACYNSTLNKNKRAVICIENEKIFESITAAAKWAGVTNGTITVACKNPNRTAAGYHWEFVETPIEEK